ncbi:MAG: CPBP family intramembrane metalloprotease, partial [Proteobacteria bacterium]|nr:CPBP family intramembrane metalloprotease [Pseudomonadota bacterium]
WSIFGLRPMRWSGIGAALITMVVLTLLGFALVNTAARFELPYAPQRFGMASGSVVELLVLLPIVAILAPIAEEVLFRGVVFSWLRRRWGFSASALISALPFGLVHLEPLVIIFATIVGMILAWLYERYENLWVPIIAHCANNCGAVLWVFFGLNRFFQ